MHPAGCRRTIQEPLCARKFNKMKWSEHINYSRYGELIDDQNISKHIKSLEFFKSLFPANASLRLYSENPINKLLEFKNSHTIGYLNWLSEAIPELLKTSKNFDVILKNLVNSDQTKWNEPIPFIHISYPFHQSGFHIDFRPFFDQTLPNPDLKLTNNSYKEEFFIEITEFTSHSMDKALRNWMALNWLIESRGLYFVGYYSKRPEQKFIEYLKELIVLKCNECLVDGSAIHISEEISSGFLNLTIYPRTQINQAVKERDRLNEKGFEVSINQIKSLPYNMIKETKRLIRNKMKKLNQINIWGNGILYIEVSQLFLIGSDLTKTIEDIKRRLKLANNVIAVVLWHQNYMALSAKNSIFIGNEFWQNSISDSSANLLLNILTSLTNVQPNITE